MIEQSKTLIIAHRGDISFAPENTIESSQMALDRGANALEVDIRLCGSGELVLFHDRTLLRHFSKLKPICLSSLRELKQLQYKHPTFGQSLSIVLLTDFLEEFKNKVPLILDLKSFCSNNRKLIRTLIKNLDDLNMRSQIWTSAFNLRILGAVKQLAPDIRTGYLFNHFPQSHQLIDLFLQSDAWHPHHSLITEKLINKARNLNKELFVWTVNEESLYEELAGYQFEGIITDTLFHKGLAANKNG